jgi:membrane protein DedA with SNARE-associated domain
MDLVIVGMICSAFGMLAGHAVGYAKGKRVKRRATHKPTGYFYGESP